MLMLYASAVFKGGDVQILGKGGERDIRELDNTLETMYITRVI